MPRILPLALALLTAVASFAAWTDSALAQKRVALVVGNSDYQHTTKLANPKNDATDMSGVLKGLGFEVIDGFDLNKAAFDGKVREFAAALEGEADWSHGTVRTLLTRLVKKKAVSTQKEGRRFLYRPLVDRGAYVHAESKCLIDRLFDGRIGPFVAHFSDRQDLTPAEVNELRQLIERLDRDK